jgi:hypothetical protein
MEDLKNVLDKVNNVENGVNNLIIPILKDTIKDSNKHNTKLFIFALAELIIILITVLTAIFVVHQQNDKYQEFLSQFDYETTVYQDTDDSSVINSGITFNK